MADITTPISNIPTGPIIPQEYQDQIDQARQRQMIAQQLLMRSMQGTQPQQIGPVAAKVSPLAGLANILQGGVGAYMNSTAQADQSAAKTKFENDQAAEIQRIQGLPEEFAGPAAQASRFPQVQSIGRALLDKAEKRRELLSGVYKEGGYTPQAVEALTTGQPQTLPPRAPSRTEYIKDTNDPTGTRQIPVIWSTNKDGIEVPHPINGTTNINLGSKEAEIATTALTTQLGNRQTQAQAAQKSLQNTGLVLDALESGATAGGGQDIKQSARSLAQAFGFQIPETSSVAELKAALTKGVLDHAKEVYPVSNSDIQNIKGMVGSIDTDPTALVRIAAYEHARALKVLQDYNNYANENAQNIPDPTTKALFKSATSGYEMPTQLTGPQSYQFEVLKHLRNAGVDVSKYRFADGSEVGANPKFTGVNPTTGFSGISTAPKTPPPTTFKEGTTYTDAQGNKAIYQNGAFVPVK